MLREVDSEVCTDADAIRRSAHEPVAFEAVFERHFDRIHHYLARRVGSGLADELTAETFAVAFAKRRRYDLAYVDARPWLFGIAARLLGRHRRTEEREFRAYARSGVDRIMSEPEHDAAAALDAGSAGPALAEALAALHPTEREVLLLFAWAELSYKEIAQALGIPVGTVRSRLSRGRAQVRTSLRTHGFESLDEEASHG